MKKLFFGSVALVALGLATPAAFAADKGVPAYAPPPPAPVYTWTGCYVGAYAGTSTGRSEQISQQAATAGTSITGPFHLAGFIGGGTGGCQWQAGVWVFGIEGDGGASNKSGQRTDLSPFSSSFVHETQERWTSTLRARLGWAVWDKTMVYVTGGGAWAGVEASAWNITTPQTTAIRHKQTMSGYSVGAGAEYALGYGWSIKGEYLYLKFSDKNYFNPPDNVTGPISNFVTPVNVKLNDHTLKAGMNYKFW